MNKEITNTDIWLAVQALNPHILAPAGTRTYWVIYFNTINQIRSEISLMDALKKWYKYLIQGPTE